MYSSAVILFALGCALPLVSAQFDQEFYGKCPNVTIKAKFNETQFKGRWYEIQKFSNRLIPWDCGSPNYAQQGTGFRVTYASRNITQNRNYTDILDLKRQPVAPLPGKYDVYSRNSKDKIPHFVLDTDYKTYSVVWGCIFETTNRNKQRAFIYSRAKTLSSTNLNKALNVLRRNGIDVTKLRNVVQDDRRCARRS